ncbi:MAG: transketolase C-terminal domain-containing protein, partial [Pseudomonadota bacterium]|nr:transketolase C-terminal domain-containing protein [Pseudomonadota bacterium]
DAPSVLALTRQGLPTVREADEENMSAKGAYILSHSDGEPDVTIFASGSEVEIALATKEQLVKDKLNVRVVSVPCMDLFFEQDAEYIESLTCNDSVKIAIEAAVRQGWDRIIGAHGLFVGMQGFGDSAPANVLYKHFGITADDAARAVRERIKNKKK